MKIIGGILRDLYGLKRLSPEKQEYVTQSYDKNLTQWRNELKDFLGIINTEMLRPLFQRQHTVLELAHSQAIILLHRHALLTKSPLSIVRQDNTVQANTQYSVRRCLDAATTIVTKLRGLVEKKQMYSAYWVCPRCFVHWVCLITRPAVHSLLCILCTCCTLSLCDTKSLKASAYLEVLS